MRLVIYESKCPQDHPCSAVTVCPIGALRQEGFVAPTVDEKICTKCGKCAKRCPRGTLVLCEDS